MKYKLRLSNTGITMVALVVTIIVLIILAGVTITLVLGENGLISKAKEAKVAASNAEKIEDEQLDSIEHEMGVLLGQKMPKVSVNETATDNSTINGEKGSYSNPIIPKGFKAIDTDTAKWNDADGYNNGLVIEDDTKDETTQGSQFVWVPVQNYEDFHLIEGYNKGGTDTTLSKQSESAREAGASKEEKLPQEPNEGKNTLLGTDESVAMYKSVETYGGFYIARYEAGIKGTQASTTTDDEVKQTQDGTKKPVSINGVGVWNFVPWGGTTAKEATDGEVGNDQMPGAVKIARSMYNNPTSGSTNTATTVKSTLCYGVQWDAVMNFIDSNYLTGTCLENSVVRNGTGHGNYSSTLAVTGKDEYVHKNIYDLAGNLYEWTMEAYSSDRRIGRGGSFGVSALTSPASRRQYGGAVSSKMNNVGFRVTLYL